jgi:hypothetical protein
MFEHLPVMSNGCDSIPHLLHRTFLANFTLETEFEPFYQKQLHIIHRSPSLLIALAVDLSVSPVSLSRCPCRSLSSMDLSRTQNYFLNLNCSHLLDYPASRRFYQQLKVNCHSVGLLSLIPFQVLSTRVDPCGGHGRQC